jgi:hypothetical protein
MGTSTGCRYQVCTTIHNHLISIFSFLYVIFNILRNSDTPEAFRVPGLYGASVRIHILKHSKLKLG